jgi:hypothetical protein
MPRVKRRTSVFKPVSLDIETSKIAKEKLNYHGDFSGFVKWCLRKPELIEKYIEEVEKQYSL